MVRPLSRSLLEADVAAYRAVRRLRAPSAVRGSLALSHFGEHALGWLAVGGAGALLTRHRQDWARAAVAVATAHAANVVIKRVARRPRPDFPDLPPHGRVHGQLSFPSAHASSSFAAAAAYAPLAPRLPWRAAAVTMGLSRVVLGVHYPSDVIAGAVLGTVVGRGITRSARSRAS